MTKPSVLGVIAFALVISACGGRTPAMSDDEIAQLRETYPTMIDACVEDARNRGLDAIMVSTDRCFPMQDARAWKGVWVNEFEGSRFCPNSAGVCEYSDGGENVWLSFADGQEPQDIHPYGDGTAYFVQFIGRRTEEPGKFGHMGVSEHEIIVDELNSIEPVRSD